MGSRIVGTDITVSKLIGAMMQSAAKVSLWNNWSTVAIDTHSLDIPAIVKEQIHTNITIGLYKTTEQVYDKIITEWILKHKDNAACLGDFVKVLEDLEFNDIVRCIKKEFYPSDTTTLHSRSMLNTETPIKCSADKTDNESASANPLRMHLEYYMITLVDKMDLSDALLKKLETKNIMTNEDAIMLKSIFNSEDQKRMLWKIIIMKVANKEDIYSELIQVFESEGRNNSKGVACILNWYYGKS